MLEKINSPQELKKLNNNDLTILAKELRQCIIDTVSETGGHLGANLGVIELTLALHSVLNSPVDKIIWDVGHQCYAHKLLTGRQEQFCTLRQWQGMSGFPKILESEHDSFGVGHSSTSISAAAGMALARDLNHEKYKIAAVIGDGALTGGMAFEALNYLGQSQTNLLVILNDNAMSITSNVGALSDYLNRLRMDPTLSKAKDEIEALVKRIPGIGGSMTKVATGLKDAVKSLLPGQLFTELGFSYFGPLDGHNIYQIQRALKEGFNRKGPVLLHVITQKGKGYAPAERNPAKFHGVSPKINNKKLEEGSVSYSKVFGDTLCKIGADNLQVVAISAAMTIGTGLEKFSQKYPTRFFDVGIAEQHALTFAAGMAAKGLRPVVALYSTFLQRAYDQLLHDICLQNLPVIIGVDRAGVVGDDGPTHHGVFDISFLRHIPNLTLLAPSNGVELQGMLHWALTQNGPVAIRYPRGMTLCDYVVPINDYTKSKVLNYGEDCTLLAVGNRVSEALEAARFLAGKVDCNVIDVRSIKPLDEETIKYYGEKTGRVITIEDNVLAGGFGSSIAELFAQDSNVSVFRLGYPDEFISQGTQEQLYDMYKLDKKGIIETIQDLFTSRTQKLAVEGE